MGVVAPRTPADRMRAFSDGTVSDLLANMTLEPSNYILNWSFSDLNDDNDPDNFGDGIIMPEDPEGIFVHMSDVNSGQNTMAAQNTAPIDIEEESWTFDEPYVPGHSPRTKQFSAPIAPPVFYQSNISVIPSAKTGFVAGTYLAGYTWVKAVRGGKRRGRARYLHTRISPTTPVTVGTGQYIRATLPSSIPEGVTHIGIWLSAPNGGEGGMRLQMLVPARHAPPSILLKGPWIRRKRGANENEHTGNSPKAPRARRRKGTRHGKRGIYRARIAEIDPETGEEGVPSEWSDFIELTAQDETDGVAIEFSPQSSTLVASPDVDMQYRLYVEKDGVEYVYVDPDGQGGSTILSVRADSGTQAISNIKPALRSSPTVSGRTEEEDQQSGLSSSRSGSLRKTRRSSDSSSSSSSSQEEQRIEDPDSPFESVVAEGKVLPTPGTYWVAISYYVRGEETLTSRPYKVTITSGQTIRVWFPPGINVLRNSQFTDIDGDGKPDGWTLFNAGGGVNEGSFRFDEDGSLILDSNGLKTGTQLTPFLWQDIEINREDRWVFGGEIQATVLAGLANVQVEEFNGANQNVRITLLKSLSSSGDVEFSKTFGPDYTPFHPDTAFARLTVYMAESGGTGRNAIVDVNELYAMPFVRRVRRRERPRYRSRRFSNPRPQPSVRWEKAASKGVELPPVKFALSPQFVPLDVMTFDTGSVSSGWTLRQVDGGGSTNTSGLTAAVQTGAKIDGTYGLKFAKSTSSTRYQYLYRSFTPTTRTRIALHAKVRINQLPSRGSVALLGIKDAAPQDGVRNLLGGMFLRNTGELYWQARDGSLLGIWSVTLDPTVKAGDVLDLELIVAGGNSTEGIIYAGYGKNGATRTFATPKGGLNFNNSYPRHCFVGPYYLESGAATYDFDFDSVVTTEQGDVTTGSSTPSLDAYPKPDRPYLTVPSLEDVTFEDNTIPWTTVRTPTDATTTVTVQSASAIEGTRGLRVATASPTSSSATAYIQKTLTPTNSQGFRERIRVVSRPSAGNVRLMRVASVANGTLAAITLDSVGDLWAYTGNGVTLSAGTKIQSGIANGSILTLEIVCSGGQTTGGSASFWVSVGGTGAIEERSMYHQASSLDWSSVQVGRLEAGITQISATGISSSLDIDAIRRTSLGEVRFSEFTQSNTPIYQVNYFLPPGSPLRDDLMVQNVRIAVRPNEMYTCAIKARHAGVEEVSYPFFLTAYDTAGTEHEIGDLYGDGGCIGTEDWADRSRTFTVPAGCYEVRINSRQMGHGEWCFQEPAFSRGTQAVREVTYPVSGTHRVILDTETSGKNWLTPPVFNQWLHNGAVFTVPDGCSVVEQYQSSDSTRDPTTWLSDPSLVGPNKYAHYRFTLYSDSTQRLTPTLASGSPYVEFYSKLAAEHLPSLLRDDFSEFSGGVYVAGLQFPKNIGRYDVRSPQGRVRRHLINAPVGKISGFTIVAYTEAAMTEIEEKFLEEDFVVEGHGRRMTVRFTEPTEFAVDPQTVRNIGGHYFGRGEADSGAEVEVVSVDPIPELWSA